jgi:O-antigen/teichoic acid export membrane protein
MADTFVSGIVAMLLINAIQRLVGLGRNLGFCHFLSDQELGLWSLANSFFILAPPFIVLGLPGSFGKFVEYYRQRGCLGTFLKRVAGVCGLTLLVAAGVMLVVPQWVTWSLYGRVQGMDVLLWTVITLMILTVHNVIYDVALSLRMVRLVSMMQFVNSLSFCVLGIVGIGITRSWVMLIPSYGIACLLAGLLGWVGIHREARTEFVSAPSLPIGEMWRRVVPFAAAVWMTNFLSSAFELSDRYMLVHFCAQGEQAGQGLVGQYYCGRILPNLLYSLAMMFSGVLLPYLSADWERGDFASIGRRMRQVLPILSLAFVGISVASLVAAPLLFDWGLGGRYEQAKSILGISLVQTIWSSLSMTAAAYLMCAERGKQSAMLLATGVVLNLLLNGFLIAKFGLYGAIVATATSNLVVMMGTFWRVHQEGCHLDARVLVAGFFPVLLLLGPELTMVGFLAMTVIAVRTDWLLNEEDRSELDQAIIPKLRKLHLPIQSLWPSARTTVSLTDEVRLGCAQHLSTESAGGSR